MSLLRYLTLGLALTALTFTVGCDDDDDTGSGTAAGEAAGEGAGEAAGEGAGEGAGEAAGEGAGEAAGEGAGEAAGEGAGEAAGEGAGEAAGEGAGEAAGETPEEKNIVEFAVEDGRFTTLVAAVQAAGLVDLLSSEGPYTVLAPTDDAFAALPEGTVESLVADAQGGGTALAEILTLHVVAGAAVMSGDLTDGQIVETEGGNLTVGVTAEGVTFTSEGGSVATVIIADVDVSNGVIHAIDQVLLPAGDPEPTLNIVETAVDAGSFTTLVAAVEAAGLVETLSGEGPFTVLAPTDEAFALLPDGTVEALVMDAQEGGSDLADILTLHVVGAAVLSGDLTDAQVVETLGGNLTVGIDGDTVTFTSESGSVATVVMANVLTTNGVIHAIDAVLLP